MLLNVLDKSLIPHNLVHLSQSVSLSVSLRSLSLLCLSVSLSVSLSLSLSFSLVLPYSLLTHVILCRPLSLPSPTVQVFHADIGLSSLILSAIIVFQTWFTSTLYISSLLFILVILYISSCYLYLLFCLTSIDRHCTEILVDKCFCVLTSVELNSSIINWHSRKYSCHVKILIS